MQQKLINLMSEIFDLPEAEITVEASMSTIDNWDSLSHLQLIAGIEENFNIQIDTEEVLQMTTVENILEILKKKG
ncbi:acyl carrier protein [Candidatus Peregrinibacteria bacterium RIFOXYC2_FULL_33_13]|nr:MAG: Acyl carrier protein [Candidatus Peregrinibacteria bacterium GW2011_GWA2_33_10]KKP38879.1 MAG: acyl carrier protein, acyl carrier protein [Candidatus Peregrinibacteria bacterium GW2011_GWC2_33_13]OGJ46722.1 MAG: acyl carrier protein [Candidatus Peregrinibacteria bacterium RIFOXYA2_FULL_33_7]OGJ52220.1 MAG: acyl carrier protein [Candidatus Peregrinibacteria bacterium RIFOXYC2_FULL_33_13]